MSALSARDGYRRWAGTYERETAVSFLEERLVAGLGVRTAARSLLDVGCGIARRLDAAGAELAIGVDLSTDMLARAAPRHVVAAADLRALPFADGAFDVVWCRLVIGHVRELASAYAELGRVTRPGGDIVVTDFHPDAAAAGHRRTFRDADGLSHELEHYVHATKAHGDAARNAGLALTNRSDGCVGEIVEPFYAAAGRLDAYGAQRGLHLVLALAFRKPA